MGLADSMVGAVKTIFGKGIGYLLMLLGILMAVFGMGDIGPIVVGIILFVIGGGFLMWGEQSRRNTLR